MANIKGETKRRSPRMVEFHFVRCKEKMGGLHRWIMPHNIIYSKCADCGADTSYRGHNYEQHYDLFQINLRKGKRKWDDLAAEADELAQEDDPEKYRVEKFYDVS